MQPDPYHAVPEEKRNINGFRILPSGALVTDTPPFDRLFEEGTGNGLYALAVSNWETVSDPGAFFIKNMARQALTRMAHAAAERPDEVDAVLDHLPTLVSSFNGRSFPSAPCVPEGKGAAIFSRACRIPSFFTFTCVRQKGR